MFTACGCMLGVRYAALKCLYVSWHLLSLCSGVHALRSIELGRGDNAELMDDFVRVIAWTLVRIYVQVACSRARCIVRTD